MNVGENKDKKELQSHLVGKLVQPYGNQHGVSLKKTQSKAPT